MVPDTSDDMPPSFRASLFYFATASFHVAGCARVQCRERVVAAVTPHAVVSRDVAVYLSRWLPLPGSGLGPQGCADVRGVLDCTPWVAREDVRAVTMHDTVRLESIDHAHAAEWCGADVLAVTSLSHGTPPKWELGKPTEWADRTVVLTAVEQPVGQAPFSFNVLRASSDAIVGVCVSVAPLAPPHASLGTVMPRQHLFRKLTHDTPTADDEWTVAYAQDSWSHDSSPEDSSGESGSDVLSSQGSSRDHSEHRGHTSLPEERDHRALLVHDWTFLAGPEPKGFRGEYSRTKTHIIASTYRDLELVAHRLANAVATDRYTEHMRWQQASMGYTTPGVHLLYQEPEEIRRTFASRTPIGLLARELGCE